MADNDLATLVTRARNGDPATLAALIAALQRDLRSFLATFAGSRTMVDDSARATWAECRRQLAKCPPGDEAATWVRQMAMTQLQPRLEAELRQAIAAKDPLRHLVLQDGMEALRALGGPLNSDAQHVAGRYPALTEPLQVLIARRYTDRASLAELAKERGIGEAELAIRLFVARASLHPRSTATDARPPDDRLLPAQIEQALGGSLPAEARAALAASLLKDLGRAAAYTRQLRIDLLLEALFGPDPDALALANQLVANDKKRRNESSLLQVVAPPRTPVSSGSDLRRTGEVLAAKQTRPTSDATRRLARKSEGARPSKVGSKLRRASEPAAIDDDEERPARGNRNALYIGGGLALIGLISLVVVWYSGGPAASAEKTGGAAPSAATPAVSGMARVLATSGTATVVDEGRRSNASEGQGLRSGQGLEIGEKSSLVLELPELARLELRAGTQIGALAERGAQRDVHVLLSQGTLSATVSGGSRTLVVITAQGRVEVIGGTCTVSAIPGRMGVEVAAGTAQLARPDGSKAIAVASGKRGTVTDRDDPRVDGGSVFARGINLGGNVVTIERNAWLSHRQALSAGLTVIPGTEIAPPTSVSSPGLDFDLKSMLDSGLTSNAGPVHLTQKVPNGDYDVWLWLAGTRGVSAESLTLNQRETPIGQPTIRNENWWRIGPYHVTATDKLLDLQITCANATRLCGMAIHGQGSPPPVLPVALTIVSPGDSVRLYTSDTITLRTEALGAQGITVSYFNNDAPLGESSKAPYAVTLDKPKPGDYRVIARTTNGGETSVSLPLAFTVAQAGGSGTITWNRWDGIGGDKLSSANGNPKLNGKPNQTRQLTEFEAPNNSADDFFARIRGYVVAPVTGDYVFWITADDEGELLLSSDDQPANKKRIANCPDAAPPHDWNKFPGQQSKPVTLTAGTRYYIEAVYKEGKVIDHCAVGWKLPNGTLERPIPGAHLVPYSGP
jgi:DNA-directed RNA polymerase specialized sigma24 family protein